MFHDATGLASLFSRLIRSRSSFGVVGEDVGSFPAPESSDIETTRANANLPGALSPAESCRDPLWLVGQARAGLWLCERRKKIGSLSQFPLSKRWSWLSAVFHRGSDERPSQRLLQNAW